MSEELAVQEQAPLALFGTNDPVQVIATASRVATALAQVVNERKLYAVVNGKKFPTVEAWTLLGSMLGVFPITEWVHELRDAEGNVRGFEARVRAQTLSGRIVGAGEARCIRGESKTWHANAQEFAMASMAQTRATSKALRGPLDFVFKLAGFQPTPAEEMAGSERGWDRPTGEIPAAQASQESQDALRTAEEIPAPTTKFGGISQAVGVVEPALPAVAPQNGKRRGRPLGSKNHVKDEQGAPKLSGDAPVSAGSPAAAATLPSPVVFGDNPDPDPDPLKPLRGELYSVASRLLKLQYIDKGGDFPPSERWEAEVYKTLGTYIERKHGTGVTLYDLEEPSLRAAIAELKVYVGRMMGGEDEPKPGNGLGEGELGTPRVTPPPPSADTRTVSLHKPIVRNAVAAPRRGGEATQVDPQAALDRARLLAELRSRTVTLLAAKEGLSTITVDDEERLRLKADAVMEAAAGNSFHRSSIHALSAAQLEVLVERARVASK